MGKRKNNLKIKVGDVVCNERLRTGDQTSFPDIVVKETYEKIFFGLYFVPGVGYQEIEMPYLCINCVNYRDIATIDEEGNYELVDFDDY